jgi:DNA-binding MarR family transcriptional regulator
MKYIHDMALTSSTTPSASGTAVDQVLELALLLQRDMALSFERDGLTAARAHLLWELRDEPVTQRRLADALGVTPRNITGLVDGLAASGHVVRRPHPTDRRATLVGLTEQGRRLVDAMVEGYAEMHGVLFGHLTPRQLATFRKTLATVVDRLRDRLEEEWG